MGLIIKCLQFTNVIFYWLFFFHAQLERNILQEEHSGEHIYTTKQPLTNYEQWQLHIIIKLGVFWCNDLENS